MTNVRRRAREVALQILYTADISVNAESLDADVDSLAPGTTARRYCDTLVEGVCSNKAALDALIEEYSDNWVVDRMAVVDRNILRIAAWELKYTGDVPFKVAIDEAVELAKRYSAEDSSAFINGVLDKMRKGLEQSGGAKSVGL